MGKDALHQRVWDERRRFRALIVLAFSVLMVVLDTTIVNVALPSIREDLRLTESSLIWTVNAYMLTFGGFLLLGGRLGDVYGQRRVFLVGLAMFTTASIACGAASTQLLLVMARAVQGMGGAMVIAVALPLIVHLFPNQAERSKALGVYGFVTASGGSVGLLLGGVLTSKLNWHWVFLVNIPIGMAILVLSLILVPAVRPEPRDKPLDVWGAMTGTASVILALYVVSNASDAGWASARTLTLTAGATIIFFLFLIIESRASAPLMPLSIFKVRNLTVTGLVSGLWSASARTWFLISALYMQIVLELEPMYVALVFLLSTSISAVLSLTVSARLVGRFGIRKSLAIGMFLGAVGLALLARAPVGASVSNDLLPAMMFFGMALGIVGNPMLLAAMSDVARSDSGLASGIVSTVAQMGGTVGLTLFVSASAPSTSALFATGRESVAALTAGYHVAFCLAALSASLGALLAILLLREPATAVPQKRNEVRATIANSGK